MRAIKYFLKDLTKFILRRLGYRLVPERVIEQYIHRKTDPYLSLYDEADKTANPPDDRAGDDFSKERRFFTLWQGLREVVRNGIEGDFAECGCKHGHSSLIMVQEIQNAGLSGREMWIFDSFEGGLSDKQEKDRETALGDTRAGKTKQQKQRFSSSYEAVQETFKAYPFVRIIKGWIPQSLDCEAKERQFAFAHLDVDLYEPTKTALEFFYQRMNKGGVIVVDDYGSATFPGCQRAVDEFLQTHQHSFFLISHTLGCVIVK